MKKFHLIYRTTCTITGKFYIGMHSTDNVNDAYLGSGKLLLRSIKAHGRDAHVKEILEYLPNRELLRQRERELITEELVHDRLCMNAALGGTGGTLGKEFEDAVLSGLRKRARRIKEDPEYRELHKQLASKAGKIGGRKGALARIDRMNTDPEFAAEVKRKMSEAAKEFWRKRKQEDCMSSLNATKVNQNTL